MGAPAAPAGAHRSRRPPGRFDGAAARGPAPLSGGAAGCRARGAPCTVAQWAPVALKSTICKASLRIADLDRAVYADHVLTIALHPSETEERMMVRLLAFALQAPADDALGALQLARGLSAADEPDLWQRDLTGRIVHWIDVGQVDERRLAKACGRAERVTLYAYAASVPVWWRALEGKVARLRNLGYIDPTVLTGERDERVLLLAGRSWRVTDVDWSKRIVWLEPAAGAGIARWIGGARSLGRGVCQGIRTVLANGASPAITLSRRARTALEALADEIPMSSGTDDVLSRFEGAPAQTWTFAGTRANRTLARQASTGAAKVRFDALSVQAPVAALAATLPERIDLTGDELAAFHEAIKFADCVPRGLLCRTIVARKFEVTRGPGGHAV